MENKKGVFNKGGQLAGLLFVAAAVILLIIAVIRFLGWYFNFRGLLCVAANGFLGAVLLMQRRDNLLLIASGVLALVNLLFAGIIAFVGSALLLFLVLVVTTEYLPQAKELAQKAWFVPAIVMFLAELLGVRSFGALLFALCVGAGALFCGMWLARADGMPQKEKKAAVSGDEGSMTVSTSAVDGYCELFKHVLLLLITFGVWYFIWIYRTTRYLNRVGEERKPVAKLLLCMFVPFYLMYWTYKSAQRVDAMAASVGVDSNLSTLCLILSVILPMLTPVLLQDKINAVIDVERGVRQPNYDPADNEDLPVTATAKGTDGYCDLFKHMLLLLLTCGIWNFIWIYRMTKYLNRVGEERKPVAKLLLCMFVPFYLVYWIYKSAQRIDKLAAQTGVKSELSVLCLILCLVVGLVPYILMQEKVNEIIVTETANVE